MTCWIWAPVAPSCITMTMRASFSKRCSGGTLVPCLFFESAQIGNAGLKPGLYNNPTHAYRRGRSFIPAFAVTVAGMHGVAFGGAGFVNDALEETADRGVGQRAGIIALGIGEHFVLAVGLVQRNFGLLFELADFQSAARTFVQEFDELLVDFVDAPSPVAEVHGRAPRHRRPRTDESEDWKWIGRIGRAEDLSAMGCAARLVVAQHAAPLQRETKSQVALCIMALPRGERGRGGRHP